jgi:hypothetical protein
MLARELLKIPLFAWKLGSTEFGKLSHQAISDWMAPDSSYMPGSCLVDSCENRQPAGPEVSWLEVKQIGHGRAFVGSWGNGM